VYAIAREATALVAAYTEPGEVRERLHYRFFQQDVFARLERRYLDATAEDKKITLAGCGELLELWGTPGLLDRFNGLRRLIAHCARNGLETELEELLRFHQSGEATRVHLEDGRAYARYPFFRDATAGIPDSFYETSPRLVSTVRAVTREGADLEISGTVLIRGVDEGTPSVHLVLENDGARHRIECATAATPGDPHGEGRVTAF
ncbi:hypothetical protein ACFQ07_10535, partial [Actinomadura adrarensis]